MSEILRVQDDTRLVCENCMGWLDVCEGCGCSFKYKRIVHCEFEDNHIGHVHYCNKCRKERKEED